MYKNTYYVMLCNVVYCNVIVSMHACTHACKYIYMYIHMYIYIYTHTHTHTHIYIYIYRYVYPIKGFGRLAFRSFRIQQASKSSTASFLLTFMARSKLPFLKTAQGFNCQGCHGMSWYVMILATDIHSTCSWATLCSWCRAWCETGDGRSF